MASVPRSAVNSLLLKTGSGGHVGGGTTLCGPHEQARCWAAGALGLVPSEIRTSLAPPYYAANLTP